MSISCNTRASTNDSKKGWSRRWHRASMSIHLGFAAASKTRASRAFASAHRNELQKASQPQRDQQFGKKGPQKAAVTTKAEGCLTSRAARAAKKAALQKASKARSNAAPPATATAGTR